jgi:hypothetical protein
MSVFRRPWGLEAAIYFVLGLLIGWVFLKAVGCGRSAEVEHCTPPATRCLAHKSDGYADRLEVCMGDGLWHFAATCQQGTVCLGDSACVFP